MSIQIGVPENILLKPTITVFGVGGAGGNAINNMISSKLEGVNFVAANTDSQALANSLATKRIQLGETVTRGLGAGALPEIGAASAEEAMEQISECLQDSNMVFITAGMGGGTGTGAGPIIAKAAKEQGILTIGVVTKPFHFEGSHRMTLAERGVEELAKYVDTLIVIPNQNLFRIANEDTTFSDAFMLADNVLNTGVRGITDLMIMPGLINLDFADIKTVMSEMGKAMMGTGESDGDGRAIKAAEAAISNPLLAHASMKGAKGVLINITGGKDMTLFEVDEAANRIRDEIENENANIIFGSTFNDAMEGRMRVSVVATGIDQKNKISISTISTTKSETTISEDGEIDIDKTTVSHQHIDTSNEDEQHHKSESENLELNFQEEKDPEPVKQKNNLKSSISGLFNKFTKKVQNSEKEQGIDSQNNTSENESLDQEVYDIPAFIRRNKND
ncbi:MAG: cell division protein FtsZ [Rickettsiales bacterium]